MESLQGDEVWSGYSLEDSAMADLRKFITGVHNRSITGVCSTDNPELVIWLGANL